MKLWLAISLVLACIVTHAQEFKLGSKVTNFEIQDLSGKAVSFASLRGPVTVLTFISTKCPISNGYNDRMNSIYKDYSAKGIKFVFVNANRDEPPREVQEHAQSVGFAFPVYKDSRNEVADRFGAQVTPESYVIDSTDTIRYHGSVDDSLNEARVKTRGLRMALDAVMAGKQVQIPQTKAFGCTIKRVRKST
jgi:thiol-disulfide isomerase/thioredoxin